MFGKTPHPSGHHTQHDGSFPLSPTQQALLVGREEHLKLGGVGCLAYFEWQIADFDLESFVSAWTALVERHPMLRAVATGDGNQHVRRGPVDFTIPVADLSAVGTDEIKAHLARQRAAMDHHVFPIGTWPAYDTRITLMPRGVGHVALGIDLLVMDASSLFLAFFPDLIDLLEGKQDLPPLERTFSEHMLKPRGDDAEAAAARDYWLARLDDLPPAPSLPAPRTPQPLAFARRELLLDTADRSRLEDVAAQADVTSSELLTAIIADALRLWSPERDFTINYPIFDRPADFDGVIGDFTNPLLLACSGEGSTFLARLHALRDQLRRDRAHTLMNGVEVIREITRRQGVGAQASFPVVVTSLLDYPARRPVTDLGEEVYSISQTPQVSLDIQIREMGEQLRIVWDYRSDAFESEAIDAVFSSMAEAIALLARSPEALEHPYLVAPPAAHAAVLAQLNDTGVEIDETHIFDLFAARAAATPDAPAVIDAQGTSLTYDQLLRAARCIGSAVHEHSAGRDDVVAILADKGWEQYAAVFGALAAGAAYIPVDTAQPAHRIAKILTDTGVQAVLTTQRCRHVVPDSVQCPVLDVALVTHEGNDDLPQLERSGSDLAYVISTSGSTGTPKNVEVESRSVINLVRDVQSRFSITAEDRGIAISGLHFDASVADLYIPLLTGGSVIVPSPFERPEPDRWVELLQRYGVTWWNSVPVLMELMVGELENRDETLASLRLCVLSGDWIPLSLPARIRTVAPSCRVVGSGGPTETICWSLFHEIDEVDPDRPSIPYGRPIANQRYHIVDNALQIRPLGAVGEIAVASDIGLARGYRNDPELTAARFVTLPQTGERAYLTGDLGQHMTDGTLEILGRVDFQVKISGHRIELAEVEAAANQHEGVRRVVVVLDGSTPARQLCAHVEPVPGAQLDGAAVLSTIADRLPGYMVPASVHFHTELPMTRNGKVDRRQLAALANAPQAPTTNKVVARHDDALTVVIASCVADLLGLDHVDGGDNFFRLGGDSMSGTRLAVTLREILGVAVPVRRIFESPLIRDLAASIAADPVGGKEATDVAQLLAQEASLRSKSVAFPESRL